MATEPGPSEQQYSLRWNDFHSAILSSFRHLRDEEDFVDVTLACDGCSFNAHKVVLSACSPYFRKLLKANPCQHPIVILRDIQQKDMESLLRFMYNGEVHIGQEQLGDFLKAAQMLQVRGLADVPTPGVPINNIDHKVSPSSTSLPWPEAPHSDSSRERSRSRREHGVHSPPPTKRTRSSDLYNAQLRNRVESLTGQNHRSPERGINNGLDLRDSLLGQALEGTPTSHPNNNMKMNENSLQAHSTGEDSSSDAAMSDSEMDLPPRHAPMTAKQEPLDYCGEDMGMTGHNGSMLDPQRNPNFPGALLGLQGLLPGPSGMHGTPDNFDAAVTLRESTAPHIIKPEATASPDALQFRDPQLSPVDEQTYSYLDNDLMKILTSSVVRNSILLKHYHNEGELDCPLCGMPLTSLALARQHIDVHYPRDSPLCPVSSCARLFAHPNSVRNHMRIKHPQQWDKMKTLKWSCGWNA